MSRKLRLEYEGAYYHVINRGNYRKGLFETIGAREAFLKCLGEACVKSRWVVHGYILMSNHYHLALETPKGNLVAGMKWLQSTFANRYNRLRRENGHVFQGRYKALVVEDQAGLGAVCHYIHLNPVRARLLPISRLAEHRESSYWMLQNPRKRPSWLSLQTALVTSGDLADTVAGRRSYLDYLTWLAENQDAQKELNFLTMTKGWALGSKAFKKALTKDHEATLAATPAERATGEVRELLWETALQSALKRLGKSPLDIEQDRKAAPWKVAIATHFKTVSGATNGWLATKLGMGAPAGVSRYVSELRSCKRKGTNLLHKISNITV